MLPPPGYSINDLITVAGWVKSVYEAFFHEFKNADAQLADLAHDVDAFQEKLRQYQQNLANLGLEDPGRESVRKTLLQCTKFLDDYKLARKNKDGRRLSFMGKVKTGLFAGEEDELKRLRDKLNDHKLDMVLDSVNIMSQGHHRSRQLLSAPIPIPGGSPVPHSIAEDNEPPISPPVTPNLSLGSPLLGRGSFDPLPRPAQHLSPTGLFDSEPEVATPSRIIHTPAPPAPISPRTVPKPTLQQQSTTIPEFSLPEPVLLYGAGAVSFGLGRGDCIKFTRKPIGSDYERGRQIEIRDRTGKQCFRHRIRISPDDSLYPYTQHSKFQKNPGRFEVNIKEAPPPNHKISKNGGEQTRPASIPIYIFTDKRDYEDFQSQVRGKLLEGTFEVGFVDSALSSKKKHEASNEHLKIWRDRFSKECTLSYYASAAEKPGHVEYPMSMFQSDIVENDLSVRLNFIVAATPKKARTFSKAFSKSPTESSESVATTSPRIFTRNNTGMSSHASSATSAPPSRMSVASSNFSESGQASIPDKESVLESQAKKMKYLNFEFSDETGDETTRFKQLYERLRKETSTTDLDHIIDWRNTTKPGRPESVMSTSPRGTPYDRSPEVRANGPLQQDCR